VQPQTRWIWLYVGATWRPIAHRKAAISRDGGDDNRQLFAGIAQPAIPGAQADLPFPGNVANDFGQPFEPGPEGLADPGGVTVGPGCLDQHPAGAAIAARVSPLRRTVSPVELSAGAKPRKDISWRGLSNRRTSPISAAKVTATINEAPRIAW
jgi:hypothetical protein